MGYGNVAPGGIMVYGRYISPEQADVVEKSVFKDIRRHLSREGDLKTPWEIYNRAYEMTQRRIKRP
jgi:hypothetical protein